jgi:hypothetical protein
LRQRFESTSDAHARFAKRVDNLVSAGSYSSEDADAVLSLVESMGTKPEFLDRVQLVPEKIRKGKAFAPGRVDDPQAPGKGIRRGRTEFARLSILSDLRGVLREKGLESNLDLQPVAVTLEEFGHIAGELGAGCGASMQAEPPRSGRRGSRSTAGTLTGRTMPRA